MQLMQEILANPVLLGGLGLASGGGVVYYLKEIPKQIYEAVKNQFTTTLEIDGRSIGYHWFDEWLANHTYTKRARTLKLSARNKVDGNTGWALAPGYERHWIWHDGSLLIVNRAKDTTKASLHSDANGDERLTITTIGRSQSLLRELVKNAYTHVCDPTKQKLLHWGMYDGWCEGIGTTKRTLDSVFCPPVQKHTLVSRARWFLDNQEWYRHRGVPYRFGILLSGPPGTGKTSLVRALATELDKPICILSLSTIEGDNKLLSALREVPTGAIVLIEDVDSFNVAIKRKENDDGQSLKDLVQGVTLSGLLNAIDGVAAPEGVLLCMTTNHPEKLDPALLRSGRVDLSLEIGLMKPEQVGEMAERFKPGSGEAYRARASNMPLRPASDWQNDLMGDEVCS